jgi:hypothetical protein
MNTYQITVTVHRDANSANDAALHVAAEFLSGHKTIGSVQVLNIANPCDCKFLQVNAPNEVTT